LRAEHVLVCDEALARLRQAFGVEAEYAEGLGAQHRTLKIVRPDLGGLVEPSGLRYTHPGTIRSSARCLKRFSEVRSEGGVMLTLVNVVLAVMAVVVVYWGLRVLLSRGS
jgi:hypothetical protein